MGRTTVRALLVPAALVVLLLGAVACSDEPEEAAAATAVGTSGATGIATPEVTATGTPEVTAAIAESVEHDTPQPRLVMIEGDTGMIQVFDIAAGEVIARFPSAVESVSPGEAPSVSENGRFVFFSHYGGDAVTILDAGTWSVPHGDHAHHYTQDPVAIGVLEGPQPTHVVNHDGIVAVYFDGDGRVDLLDEAALATGEAVVTDSFVARGPHHGVAVPSHGCFVTSLPAATPDDQPSAIGLFCEGEFVQEIADCPDLHGEAPLGTTLVFACADGLRVINHNSGEWSATSVSYPEGIDDQDHFGASYPRAWAFQSAPHASYLTAWAGSRHLYVFGGDSGQGITAIDLGQPIEIYGSAVVPGSRTALVLTTDGHLHRVDLELGEVVESVEVVAAFEPDLTFERPHHYVVATAKHAFILDPTTNQLIEVSLDGSMAIERTFDLDGSVAQLALARG